MPSHVGTAIFCLGLILAHAYCQSTPFTGSPVNLPGVIHAANFDRGGEGVGYHDVDAANLGGEYRLAEGVDIGRCRDTASQGYSIGWTRAGEWMQYTVNIATTATYQMNVRYASNGGGGTAHFEQNGVDVTGPISFGTTGDWQSWATRTVSARLTAANNAKLRIVYDSVGSTGSVANFNFFNVTATGASSAPVSPFKLQTEYSGNNFFDGFNFFNAPDPTHGYVTYVNRDVATSASLARVTASGQILMAVDNSSIASGAGRRAVRIESKANYNGGLFVLDVEHMPTGCGTWPAYWLNGPNWPNGGEIDIFEGVNKQSATVSVLHTNPGCAMYNMDASKMTGTWIARNCYVQAPGQSANQGCSLNGPAGSFGAPFNAGKGGHHATIWDSTGISMWFWPRGTAPLDLESGNPLPATWGKPYGRFDFGTECPSSHFSNHRIIMNIALCGDWAGNVFGSQCPGLGSCQSYVQNNPKAFSEAFWLLNSIRVYQPK